MTPLASLLFTLAGEVLVVTAFGSIAERILPAVRDRRRAWCAILSVLMIVSAAELTGLRPGFRSALLERFRAPQTRSVRTFSADVSSREVFQEVDSAPAVFQYEALVPPPVVNPRWTSFLIGAWLVGTLLMAGRCLFSRWQLHRLVRRSDVVEVDDARDLAMRLGLRIHRIQLREAEGFTGPVAFGIVRPTILLPRGFSAQHAPLELRVLLAHELAHLAARDPLWLALADGLATLLWWHPAVWWARRRLRATSEAAADEASNLVPGGRVALAEALVALGQKLVTETSSAGFGVGGLKSELARRVTRLLANPNSIGSRRLPWIVGTGFATALLGIAAAPWPGEGAKPVLMAALATLEKPVEAKQPVPIRGPAEGAPSLQLISVTNPPGYSVYVSLRDPAGSTGGTFTTPVFVARFGPNSSTPTTNHLPADIGTNRNLLAYDSTPFFVGGEASARSAAKTRAALKKIILPEFEVGTVSLGEAITKLFDLTLHNDPEHVGVFMTVRSNVTATTSTFSPHLESTPLLRGISLHNVPLEEALDAISKSSGIPWTIQDWGDIHFSQPSVGIVGPNSPGRTRITAQLDKIVLPEFDLEPMPITEALRDLTDAASQLDPEKRGVNILLNFDDTESANGNTTESTKPRLRKGIRLRNTTLRQALNTIVGASSKPLDWSIEDYAIVLSAPQGDTLQLHTRIFKLSGDEFMKVVQPFQTPGTTNSIASIQTGVRAFFASHEINFPQIIGTNTPAQDHRAFFFNDRRGVLFVRATLDELDRIKGMLARLGLGDSPGGVTPATSSKPHSTPARQVRLDVRFAEVLESGGKGLDLDWIFGPTPTNAPTAKSGLAKELLTDANDPKGDNYRVDLSRTVGEFASLSPVQFAALIKRLETKGGVDILTAPRLITRSGQPARVVITETKTVVGDVTATAGSSTNKAALRYQTRQIEVGPSLDALTFLEGDSARMTLTAKFTEFLGYDQPKPDQSVQATTPGGKPLKGVMPLPHLRVRVAMATPLIKLGDTVVLRGPTGDNTIRFKDKVPVLGDIPLLGRLFRKEEKQVQQKRVYVFVSPVEVDAKGETK